jgi:hypothetical protein
MGCGAVLLMGLGEKPFVSVVWVETSEVWLYLAQSYYGISIGLTTRWEDVGDM